MGDPVPPPSRMRATPPPQAGEENGERRIRTLIVTGTDTGVGKTVVAAMLVLALDAYYWKPIQSGLADGTDTNTVAALTGVSGARLLPEAYRLREPLSPHRAAELDRVVIDPARLVLPEVPRGKWLIVEGAGGVLVPVTRSLLQIELFARWQAPVVVVARTALGTINHTLLTIEALRRGIPVQGIVFVGDENSDTERTIGEFSGVRILGRVPLMQRLDQAALREAFAQNFTHEDFSSSAPADAGAPDRCGKSRTGAESKSKSRKARLGGRVKHGRDKLLR